jgi:16S rRNA (uracil1498-N3)-methyltransferase
MIRIFAQGQDRVTLSSEDEHHLIRVLRVQLHESIELLIDGEVFSGIITSLNPLTIQRGEKLISHHELAFSLTLIYPLAKGERLDWVVQKATELGTTELIACHSERTIVFWQEDVLPQKFKRYQRMIMDATLQAKREKIMKMNQYLPLMDAIKLPFDRKYIASEYHLDAALTLQDIPLIKATEKVALLVGPEGGFSPLEVKQAIAEGFIAISLGKSILRTETAVTVALGILGQKGAR